MVIKRIRKVGYKPDEGYLYQKWIAADPNEELKLFVNENGYCVKRAVRSTTGRIMNYQKISNYFKSLDKVKKFREYLIANTKGRYDYVIVDYLYCDDEYVEGYELTQEQIEHIVKEYEEDEENEEEDEA